MSESTNQKTAELIDDHRHLMNAMYDVSTAMRNIQLPVYITGQERLDMQQCIEEHRKDWNTLIDNKAAELFREEWYHKEEA